MCTVLPDYNFLKLPTEIILHGTMEHLLERFDAQIV